MPSSSTVLAAAIQRVCKAAEGWRFHYSKALLMLCIVHGSAVQSLILSHCSLPPLGEVLLQEAYPLGLSCWEPEALELFLNLLPQLQQKHLTFLSKSILGSFLLFFKDICLHNCFTAKLFKSASRVGDVGSFWWQFSTPFNCRSTSRSVLYYSTTFPRHSRFDVDLLSHAIIH